MQVSDRQKIKRLERIVASIPDMIDQALTPLRMESDLLSLILKEKLELKKDEIEKYRTTIVQLHVGLQSAKSIGNALNHIGANMRKQGIIVDRKSSKFSTMPDMIQSEGAVGCNLR